VALTAHCRVGHRYVRDVLADLSEGGLFLRTRLVAAEGTEVRLAVALPRDDGPAYCTLVGSVVRVDGPRRGLGVRIREADARARLLLKEYLSGVA
jgi:hypothetical protein